MVPNIHAVKGLSRRQFRERRRFSHTFSRNVQHLLSRSTCHSHSQGADTVPVLTQFQHTESQIAAFEVTTKHQPAIPGPLKHICNVTQLTEKDRPAHSLHRHHLRAKDGNGGCWGLPPPSELSSEQPGAPQPQQQTRCKDYVWVAPSEVRSCSAMTWARASVRRLAVRPGSRYHLKGNHKRQSANRILVQLVCYKLRELSDRRLGARHRSPGKA